MLIAYLVLCSLFDLAIFHDTCVYFPPSEYEVVTNVEIGSSKHRINKRSVTSQKLKIHAHYDSTFNNQHDVQNKKQIVDDAITYWENVLTPKPESTSDNIKLNRHCESNYVVYTNNSGKFIYYCRDGCAAITTCGPVIVPPDHLNVCREFVNNQTIESGISGPGIDNVDYILYIAAAATDRCSASHVLGYAAHCQLETTLDRPIAGYINFCPDRLSSDLGGRTQSDFTARHEILHALGFAVSLYAYFRDSNGNPYTPRSPTSGRPDIGMFDSTYYIRQWSDSIIINKTRTVLSVAGSFDKQVHLFVGKNALREARNHFNCPTLDGVELEDQGGLGVAVTHWEKRILENDILTPTFTQEDRVSRITLGFLEDTGWYSADYSKAEQFNWGKNLGCDFVTKSCYEYMQLRLSRKESIWPYCDMVYQTSLSFKTSCTVNQYSYGYCNLVKHNTILSSQYRYFSSLANVQAGTEGYYGSQVYLSDYCPYMQEYSVKALDGSIVRTTKCTESSNLPKSNLLGESYGTSSVCLNQEGTWIYSRCSTTANPNIYGAGCYKIECDSTYRMLITVNSRKFQCLSDGAFVKIDSRSSDFIIKGSIICPKCLDICSSGVCSATQVYNSEKLTNEDSPCSNTGRFRTNLLLIILPFTAVIPIIVSHLTNINLAFINFTYLVC